VVFIAAAYHGGVADPTEQDLIHLRRAIVLSEQSRLKGNQPFGAVLVGGSGEVLAEAENLSLSARDHTAHAEMSALRIASPRVSMVELIRTTMYASGEPCPMCAGAMLHYGVRRLVFGIRWSENRPYQPPSPPGVTRPTVGCRDILRLAPVPVEVIGPLLEEEARVPFVAYAAGRKP
jgi:tRNA(Arg) A34 adenosine deaminase TadA